MDRQEWLSRIRQENEEEYDSVWAPDYGEKYGLYSNITHQKFIQEFLSLLPHPSSILDAACGAGRYFPALLGEGHTVVGIDQSAGMLAKARSKYPQVELVKIGLQELVYLEQFDGIICMDAMEHICPEDWPLVVYHFQEALKSRGFLYFTVEQAAEEAIQQAFIRAQKAGLPVVMGEFPDEQTYHYYPSPALVKGWLKEAGFVLMDEGEGNEYWHFIVRKGK